MSCICKYGVAAFHGSCLLARRDYVVTLLQCGRMSKDSSSVLTPRRIHLVYRDVGAFVAVDDSCIKREGGGTNERERER